VVVAVETKMGRFGGLLREIGGVLWNFGEILVVFFFFFCDFCEIFLRFF
jgi:hypothetical protein